MNAEQRWVVEHLKDAIAAYPYAAIGLDEEHLKQLYALIIELAKDKARLDWLLLGVRDIVHLPFFDEENPWRYYNKDGVLVCAGKSQRKVIDAAMKDGR